MTISALLFYTRRPDISPPEFEKYMSKHHVPLIKEVMGPHYPQTYTMRFVVRVSSGAGDRLGAIISSRGRAADDAPVVLIGSPQEVDWDAFGEMVFRDELHMQQALALLETPGGQAIKEDEENFTMVDKMKVILMGCDERF